MRSITPHMQKYTLSRPYPIPSLALTHSSIMAWELKTRMD